MKGGIEIMAQIRIRKEQSIDKQLRNFKQQCIKEGIFKEVKSRRFYVKPSEKRRRANRRNNNRRK